MIQKIKTYLLTAAMGMMLAVPALVPTIAATANCSATATGIGTGVDGTTGSSGGCTGGSTVSDNSISTIAKNIVNTFSIIVGIVAVVMVIYGGFRYITSGGDSGRVGNAKNSLIYAIIGLVIVALAQLIVHFVLAQTSNVNQ